MSSLQSSPNSAFVQRIRQRNSITDVRTLAQYRLSSISPASVISRLYSTDPNDVSTEPSLSQGEKLDELLSEQNLKGAIQFFRSNPNFKLNKSRFLEVFRAIEVRTRDAEENFINAEELQQMARSEDYPDMSPARMEMSDMYATLKDLDHLRIYGAAANDNYPAGGSKSITPILLEQATDLSMASLTPKPTNTLLVAGIVFAVSEGIASVVTGINYNIFIGGTLLISFLDNVLVNGAVFETAQRVFMPEYGKKVLKHEAGHFLLAYLLGCPVEGCVLSAWAALRDPRFGGRRTGVSAGTSFFDPQLSDQINNRKPLSRSSIDRYTAVVMAGIAAEALAFGGADGGAGDEQALVRFLTQISPRGGGARGWNSGEAVKSQARWGALQSVLLLRYYHASYDALVDALERGGDLGDCVYAIENAARADGTTPLTRPLGIVLDRGLYGEWESDPKVIHEMSSGGGGASSPAKAPVTPTTRRNGNVSMNTAKEDAVIIPTKDTEAVIRESREILEQKLKDIDKKLDAMDNFQ